MTMWTVRYKGKMTPTTVTSPTFMEAVAIAVKLSDAPILSVEYLAY